MLWTMDLNVFVVVDINSTDDDIKRWADKAAAKNLKIGSVVAPIWGGGGAMGSEEERKNYVSMVHKACHTSARSK